MKHKYVNLRIMAYRPCVYDLSDGKVYHKGAELDMRAFDLVYIGSTLLICFIYFYAYPRSEHKYLFSIIFSVLFQAFAIISDVTYKGEFTELPVTLQLLRQSLPDIKKGFATSCLVAVVSAVYLAAALLVFVRSANFLAIMFANVAVMALYVLFHSLKFHKLPGIIRMIKESAPAADIYWQ